MRKPEIDPLFLAVPEKDSLHNVTSPMITTPLIDGVIVRDFAFTDDRHHGIYPTKITEEDLSLPIEGNDLKELLTKLSMELAQVMHTPISLSTFVCNFDHTSESELEMEVQFGQEIVVLTLEPQAKNEHTKNDIQTSHVQMDDRWASMDDDTDNPVSNLELTYEPLINDFATTIEGFQKQNFSRDKWLLCLKLRAKGRLEGVGNTMRGKAKMELEDIGLLPKQKIE